MNVSSVQFSHDFSFFKRVKQSVIFSGFARRASVHSVRPVGNLVRMFVQPCRSVGNPQIALRSSLPHHRQTQTIFRSSLPFYRRVNFSLKLCLPTRRQPSRSICFPLPLRRQQTFCSRLPLPPHRQVNFRRHFPLPTRRQAASSVILSAKLANNPQF